jgi:uncharacterized glyoxalase superfamily protein PhnB
MAVKPIPDGYHTITPYLVVPGAASVIEFLQRAFGATEKHRMTEPGGRIMHAELLIGDSPLMLGEPPPDRPVITGMLYLYVPDVDATYQRALAAGAKTIREPHDEFYGDRTAAVKDHVGNQWWIATHTKDVSTQDLQKHAALREKGEK